MHSLHGNFARELFSHPRQQKIAKLFSLVCFANCAVHRATIPPLYLCHFSCYGVVALLQRVSPVKLPLLGNISHITKRSSRKAHASYFAVIGCFSLDPQLFLVYCPVADSTSTWLLNNSRLLVMKQKNSYSLVSWYPVCLERQQRQIGRSMNSQDPNTKVNLSLFIPPSLICTPRPHIHTPVLIFTPPSSCALAGQRSPPWPPSPPTL